MACNTCASHASEMRMLRIIGRIARRDWLRFVLMVKSIVNGKSWLKEKRLGADIVYGAV